MSIGRKIADEIPESWMGYISEHPRAVYAITIPIVVFTAYNFMKAIRLHVLAENFVGEVQKAASERLGG